MAVLPITTPGSPGEQVFLDATGKLPALDGSQLTGVTAIPGLHAVTHKHGGTDEVSTATPGANEIPKAGGAGTLASGWLPAATEAAQGAQEIATQVEVDTGTDDTRTVSPLKLATTPRLPTQAENDALQGTTGAPSNVNRYVTDSDPRNTNARTPTAHAASHLPGGADALTTAAPAAVGVATASAVGTAASFARSDHAHQSNTAPANVTKAAAVIGVSGEPARADHKHDVTTASAVANPPGTASAEGVSASLARADHAHALAAFGAATGTFCQGDDTRLSNDRTASGLRTASTVVSVSAATAPTSGQVLTATGGTAATWQTPTGGSTPPAIEEHFTTSNITNNTIGKLGWRTTGNGTSNALTSLSVPGHPGVLSMNPGTATVTGKRAIYLGQPSIAGGFLLSTTGLAQPLEIEWLIRIRGTVGSASLEMIQLGIAPPAEDVTTGLLQDSLVVQFNPTVSSTFRVSATNAGVQSASNGTTVVAVDTWYRVAVVYTDTGAGGSAQLKVNGANEGTPITTNFPTIALGLFAKIDGQGAGGTDPFIDMDRLRVFQTVSP